MCRCAGVEGYAAVHCIYRGRPQCKRGYDAVQQVASTSRCRAWYHLTEGNASLFGRHAEFINIILALYTRGVLCQRANSLLRPNAAVEGYAAVQIGRVRRSAGVGRYAANQERGANKGGRVHRSAREKVTRQC